ncbi:hypothetical protein BdWA1_002281 [Babesia duncani]|uniref:Uncharacterized protein n=1 Tax=Babesia duncani TaxID=323732 RepID=A0AAD9PJU0_9APIC|nr:hypothetical protein BdWA1_002281 [Babesia duncani]
MAESPLPSADFKEFAKCQKALLLEESELFFRRHNLRLLKYILPAPLPPWAKSFDDVLDKGIESEPFTTIYRHKHFLKCRVLHNWSYIETKWNVADNPRNKNIPFDLRPLSSEIIKQLDSIKEDVTQSEFSGLLVTLNSCSYPHGDGQKEISKVLAGALVECLVTNERCIKCIWVHPELSKHSSRVLLQTFLPRLMMECFELPSVTTNEGTSMYNKFVYAMHNDMDLFPRQCWLLLASTKKMSLPRHYEPSNFEEHPVDLEYGDCHSDEVGHLLLPNVDTIETPNILLTVGSEMSARNVACNCRTEKMKRSTDDQGWLDRLVGCTESYMCLMLPKRAERDRMGIYVRDGWRDLILNGVDQILIQDIKGLLPKNAHERMSVYHDDLAALVLHNSNVNGDAEEWCKLKRVDLIDVTSDTDVYMGPDYYDDDEDQGNEQTNTEKTSTQNKRRCRS